MPYRAGSRQTPSSDSASPWGCVRQPEANTWRLRCQCDDLGVVRADPGKLADVARLLYKPLGLLISVLGGLVAGAIFKRLWSAVGHEGEAPKATDEDRGWGEVIAAGTIEGAVFGSVKAAIDRAGAIGFARLTGAWPGEQELNRGSRMQQRVAPNVERDALTSRVERGSRRR